MFLNNEHLNKSFKIEEFEIDEKNSLEVIGIKIKSSFDITNSLLFKAAILRNAGLLDRLLITAHHLVIDGVSWRILLVDLYGLYLAIEKGGDGHLPKKNRKPR